MKPITLESREANLASAVSGIHLARAKQDLDQDKFCLCSAITCLLQIAVIRFTRTEDAVAYLKAKGCDELLKQFSQINGHHLQLFKSGVKPYTGTYREVYRSETIVHAAWLVDDFDSANQMLAILLDQEIGKNWPGTKFWQEYHHGLEAFVRHTPYEPRLPKLKGLEIHWASYLNLISDITNSRDYFLSLGQVRELFSKRQADKRLLVSLVDGHGNHPVKWDFREASIMRFAAASYGVQLAS